MAAGLAPNVTKGLVVSFTIDPHVPSSLLASFPVATCVPAAAT